MLGFGTQKTKLLNWEIQSTKLLVVVNNLIVTYTVFQPKGWLGFKLNLLFVADFRLFLWPGTDI